MGDMLRRGGLDTTQTRVTNLNNNQDFSARKLVIFALGVKLCERDTVNEKTSRWIIVFAFEIGMLPSEAGG